MALEILWLAVKREYHGKGIGSKLLKYCEEWAKSNGFRVLVVKTLWDEDYQPYVKTRRFYEKREFIGVAKIDPYPLWGEAAIIYIKCLA